MANTATYDRRVNIYINGHEVENTIKSIKGEMSKATNELAKMTRGTEEYNAKLKEVQQIKGILKEHQDNLKTTGSIWNQLKESSIGALGKIITIGGIATGAIALIKEGIESTEGSADKLREGIALASGALQGFFHTALSGDWGNIIENISATAKATKELVAAENELEHIRAGNKIATAELEFKKNEAMLHANESKNAADRKKYLQEAIDYQKQITTINIDELTKRSGLNEDYYRTLAGQDKDYFDQFIKRVPWIAKNYEMQFSLMDGYKARLAELKSLQEMQYGGLTAAQKEEKHYYQLLVYNLEDYITLQNDLSKPGQWDEFIEGLGSITMAGAEGEAALKRLTKQLTTTDKELEKNDLDLKARMEQYTNEYFKKEEQRNQKALKEKELMEKYTQEYFDNEHKRNQKLLADKELMEQYTNEYFKKEQDRALIDLENQLEIDADNIFAQIDDKKKKNKILRDIEIEEAEKTGASVQLINDKYDKLDKKLEEEKLKSKLKLASEFFGNVSTLFGKQTAIGKAAAIAEATINTYASATASYAALAGIPVVGPVLGFAAAAVAIAAGLANVRQIVKVNTEAKGYSIGGYTGPGGKHQPAGIVHFGEWVANADMVASPNTGPIIRALEQSRLNGMPGYANGGLAEMSASGTGAAGSSPALISSDPELKDLIRENIRVNKMLLRDGVTTRFDYLAIDNVKKGMDKLENIKSKVTM